MTRSTLTLLAALAVPWWAWAHGNVHEQIAAVSLHIERSPTNAALHLRRGELHRVHQDWTLALADFSRAEQLDPSLANFDLERGRTLLDAGRAAEARVALDHALARQPKRVEALLF